MTYGAYHGDIEKVEHSEERVEAVARLERYLAFLEADGYRDVPHGETIKPRDLRLLLSALPVGGDGEVVEGKRIGKMLSAFALRCTAFDRDYGACGHCLPCVVNRAEHFLAALKHSVPSVGGSEK